MKPNHFFFVAAAFSASLWAGTALADAPEIVAAKAQKGTGGWRFDVTLRHGDTGWDHYADGWRILDADGTELGLRTLFHPHEHEQPFTRSLSGVSIPDGIDRVFVQARDNIDGWAEPLFTVELPRK